MSWTEEFAARLEPWAQRAVNKLPASRRRTALNFLQALGDEGAALSTIVIYLRAILTMNGGKKLYRRLTESDIRDWSRGLDTHYCLPTAELYRRDIKKFLRWVHTSDMDGGKNPKCVAWIKPRHEKTDYGGSVLSQAEVKQLIDVANSQRDRALIFAAYESGCRASELVNLKIKNIEFDQGTAIVRVNGKTGERRILLYQSVPDLQLWFSMHPQKNEPENPLWLSQKGENQPLQRRGLTALVSRHVKKAGLNKRISPHTFRHSRATHLAKVLTEAQMCMYFGWRLGSKMPARYVHLSGRDTDETLRRYWGLAPRENGALEQPLKKKVCGRCSSENSVAARFCWRCQTAFDKGKEEDILARFIAGMIKRNPEIARQIMREEGLDQEIKELTGGGK